MSSFKSPVIHIWYDLFVTLQIKTLDISTSRIPPVVFYMDWSVLSLRLIGCYWTLLYAFIMKKQCKIIINFITSIRYCKYCVSFIQVYRPNEQIALYSFPHLIGKNNWEQIVKCYYERLQKNGNEILWNVSWEFGWKTSYIFWGQSLHIVMYTVEPHLSGHLCSQTDCPDNWISG